MRIKLELDQETTEKLVEIAMREKRPPAWQAEVLLRTSLGLPFPSPTPCQSTATKTARHQVQEVGAS